MRKIPRSMTSWSNNYKIWIFFLLLFVSNVILTMASTTSETTNFADDDVLAAVHGRRFKRAGGEASGTKKRKGEQGKNATVLADEQKTKAIFKRTSEAIAVEYKEQVIQQYGELNQALILRAAILYINAFRKKLKNWNRKRSDADKLLKEYTAYIKDLEQKLTVVNNNLRKLFIPLPQLKEYSDELDIYVKKPIVTDVDAEYWKNWDNLKKHKEKVIPEMERLRELYCYCSILRAMLELPPFKPKYKKIKNATMPSHSENVDDGNNCNNQQEEGPSLEGRETGRKTALLIMSEIEHLKSLKNLMELQRKNYLEVMENYEARIAFTQELCKQGKVSYSKAPDTLNLVSVEEEEQEKPVTQQAPATVATSKKQQRRRGVRPFRRQVATTMRNPAGMEQLEILMEENEQREEQFKAEINRYKHLEHENHFLTEQTHLEGLYRTQQKNRIEHLEKYIDSTLGLEIPTCQQHMLQSLEMVDKKGKNTINQLSLGTVLDLANLAIRLSLYPKDGNSVIEKRDLLLEQNLYKEFGGNDSLNCFLLFKAKPFFNLSPTQLSRHVEIWVPKEGNGSNNGASVLKNLLVNIESDLVGAKQELMDSEESLPTLQNVLHYLDIPAVSCSIAKELITNSSKFINQLLNLLFYLYLYKDINNLLSQSLPDSQEKEARMTLMHGNAKNFVQNAEEQIRGMAKIIIEHPGQAVQTLEEYGRNVC